MARNPITIEVLETPDAIDRRGSFAKAAEELNKATSAVSYAVLELEEQSDIALFQRQGRRSVLTPAGGTDKLIYFRSKSGSIEWVSPRKLTQSGTA